ncbi:MAG TPA: hypothetical protein VF049_06150 [Nocardioidaceae bacterium]|jgi:hypothetical protein
MESTAGILLIVGSFVFFLGAGLGVPRIFSEPDRSQRLRMLEENLLLWRVAQPFYVVGPLVTAAGVGVLSWAEGAGFAQVALGVSALAMLVGGACWGWMVYLRGRHYREFALGMLPAWPFTSYVLLTISGLALLGIGLLSGAAPDWLGWLTLAADVVFLGAYVRYDDIPPFVFYILLTVVGAVAL